MATSVPRKAPFPMTSMHVLHPASGGTPALFTSRVTPPSFSSASFQAESHSSLLVTSHLNVIVAHDVGLFLLFIPETHFANKTLASPNFSLSSLSVLLPSSSRRSVMQT